MTESQAASPSVSPIAEAPEATPQERNPKDVRAGFYRVRDAMQAMDLPAMRAIVDEASEKLSALCNGERWHMAIPVQATDTDMVLGRAIDLAEKLIDDLAERITEADSASLAQRADDSPSGLSEDDRQRLASIRRCIPHMVDHGGIWPRDVEFMLSLISRLTSGGSDDRQSGRTALSDEEAGALIARFEEVHLRQCAPASTFAYEKACRDLNGIRVELRAALTSRSRATEPAGTLNSELKVGGEPAGAKTPGVKDECLTIDAVARIVARVKPMLIGPAANVTQAQGWLDDVLRSYHDLALDYFALVDREPAGDGLTEEEWASIASLDAALDDPNTYLPGFFPSQFRGLRALIARLSGRESA